MPKDDTTIVKTVKRNENIFKNNVQSNPLSAPLNKAIMNNKIISITLV